MHIPSFDNFKSNSGNEEINESLSSVLKQLAIHGTKAVVAYLSENPELITDVFNELGKSKDSKVSSEISNFR